MVLGNRKWVVYLYSYSVVLATEAERERQSNCVGYWFCLWSLLGLVLSVTSHLPNSPIHVQTSNQRRVQRETPVAGNIIYIYIYKQLCEEEDSNI